MSRDRHPPPPTVYLFSATFQRSNLQTFNGLRSKSLPLTSLQMPPPANPFLWHPYKRPGGIPPRFPFWELFTFRNARTTTFSALSFQELTHSSKLRIPQVLCLPLLRKLPGVYQQFPFWFTPLAPSFEGSGCCEGNAPFAPPPYVHPCFDRSA